MIVVQRCYWYVMMLGKVYEEVYTTVFTDGGGSRGNSVVRTFRFMVPI